MLKKSKEAMSPDVWCGLNNPEISEDDADIVVFGIPYDKGVSYRAGAADAPSLMRENTITSSPVTEYVEIMDKVKVHDIGDFEGEDRDEMFAEITEKVAELTRKGTFFSMIGGDHSTTIPVEFGVDKGLDEEFGVIHIDAHMDLCDELSGSKLSHGCTQRRASELKNCDSENLFFVGIRSFELDELDFIQNNKTNILTAYDCDRIGIDNVCEQVVETMKKFNKVYLTVDIDCLDPAFAAGTGTPQFGGLSSRELLTFLRRIFEGLNIIGFDIVEIAPTLDDSWASLYAGRKILTECWGHHMRKLGKLTPVKY